MKMRLALLFLFSFVIFVVAELPSKPKGRQGKQFYNYNYPVSGINYGYQAPDPRLFFVRTSTTVTSTTTSTSTVTCTKSVATACTGRKRRGILLDEDDEEQFLISPTAVQGAEATQEPTRDSRQLMYPPELAQYHPQSGLDPFYNYVPLSYYPNLFYTGQSAANSRLFLGVAANILKALTTTITTTTTSFTVTTSTSTPACYTKVGSIQQCPI